MTTKFLEIAATDAVSAFVKAKLAGNTDQDAASAARVKLKGKLLEAFDQSPAAERWKPLAQPLSDLVADGQGLDLPLVAPSWSHAVNAGDWTWTLTADASMHFIADVLDADQMKSLGLATQEGHQFVRYAVKGALGAGVSGGATAGIWTLKAGATVAAQAAIEWYVAAASQKRLGVALVEAVPFMAAPMSLAAQLERAGDFEYWGSTVELGGQLSTSFSASAAVAGAGWTRGFDGKQAKLGYTLGISGSAKFQLEGKFRLRCLVKEAGTNAAGSKRFGIEVTLERLRSESSSLALSLSAGLDATALAQSADLWLRSHIPDPAKLDKSLDLLTHPGTAIGDKIRGALEKKFSDPKLKDLVLLAAGFGDQEALATTLAERATTPLTDEIDKLTGKVDSAVATTNALVDRWLTRVFGNLPIPTEAKTELVALVSTQLDDAKGRVEDAIGKLVGQIQSKTKSVTGEILAPFATLGEKIQEQLQGVAAEISASEASQAVRKGLSEYVDLRNRVLTVLGDAQRAKLTLEFAGTLEQTQTSQTFLRATFVPSNDLSAGERLFQALWSGRLDHLVPLLADARASGVIVGEPEGWLLAASKRVSTASLTINLFGLPISSKVTKTSDLRLQADLAGNVIASGTASVQADVENYWTERHAMLTLSALRRDTPAHSAVDFGFNGAYSARGKDIDRKQFDAMQRTLVRVSGGSGSVDIRALLHAPDPHSMEEKAFWKGVAFLLPMSLQPGEFDAFLAADAAALQGRVVDFGLRAMDAEYEGQWDKHEPPSAFLQRLSKALTGSFASPTAKLVAYLGRFPGQWTSNVSSMGNSVYEELGLDPKDMVKGSTLHLQLGVLFRLANLTRAIVALRNQCRKLSEKMSSANLDNLATVQKAAFAVVKEISDTLANFAVASSTLIGSGEMVSWPFATFAACMAETVGRAVPPGFVACAVLPGKDDQPIPLIAT